MFVNENRCGSILLSNLKLTTFAIKVNKEDFFFVAKRLERMNFNLFTFSHNNRLLKYFKCTFSFSKIITEVSKVKLKLHLTGN